MGSVGQTHPGTLVFPSLCCCQSAGVSVCNEGPDVLLFIDVPCCRKQRLPHLPIITLFQQLLCLGIVLWHCKQLSRICQRVSPLLRLSQVVQLCRDKRPLILHDTRRQTEVRAIQNLDHLVEFALRLVDLNQQVQFFRGLNGARRTQQLILFRVNTKPFRVPD